MFKYEIGKFLIANNFVITGLTGLDRGDLVYFFL